MLPYLLLAVAPLCWAGNIVLARGVITIIPPVSFAFWRWFTAFLILLPFTWKTAKKDWETALKYPRILILLSISGISAFNTLLYTAVHTITSINGALIQTTMPAFIILVSMILYREKVKAVQIAGVVLCILGAGMVVLRGNFDTFMNLSFKQGDGLMIIAVICYALYSVLLRKRPPVHPLSFLTYTFGIGALCLAPLYIWEMTFYSPMTLTLDAVLSIMYVAVFPSIIAYFCWNSGIERIGASSAGLFINLIPVFASIMAFIWLDESLNSYHIYGMILIFSGIYTFKR